MLQNKVALVTGGSRGIGAAIVLALAQEGADVAINYRSSRTQAQNVLQQVEAYGRRGLLVEGDISDLAVQQDVVSRVLNHFGRIDILVNNAGIALRKPFLEVQAEDWESVINTNLRSVYFLSQRIARNMLEQKSGVIINIASDAGLQVKNNNGIEYGIAKSGVIYLTRSLAATLAPNVRVNAISPGYTLTDMATFKDNPGKQAGIEMLLPLGRVNQPEDIASMAVFLASNHASNITGQNFIIDGGASLR